MLPLHMDGQTSKAGIETVVVLDQIEQDFVFTDVITAPVPSLLRGFSAPVVLECDYAPDELALLLAHDIDGFNRWEAGQQLAARAYEDLRDGNAGDALQAWCDALASLFGNATIDDALLADLLTPPGEIELAERETAIDPQRIHQLRQAIAATPGRTPGCRCPAPALRRAGGAYQHRAGRGQPGTPSAQAPRAGIAGPARPQRRGRTGRRAIPRRAGHGRPPRRAGRAGAQRSAAGGGGLARIPRTSRRQRAGTGQMVRRAGAGAGRTRTGARARAGARCRFHTEKSEPGAVATGRIRAQQPERLPPRRRRRLPAAGRSAGSVGRTEPADRGATGYGIQRLAAAGAAAARGGASG